VDAKEYEQFCRECIVTWEKSIERDKQDIRYSKELLAEERKRLKKAKEMLARDEERLSQARAWLEEALERVNS
jgi:hypothetical protein